MTRYQEINFDGLVGPTHHYAGHSFGNEASVKHSGLKSSPKKAALEGLAKAKSVSDLGLKAGIFPPIRRPDLSYLYRLGFRGSDRELLEKAFKQNPKLCSALYSASSMWVANSCTVSPSLDTSDHKAHFTPANLSSKLHRSLEVESTSKMLRSIFRGPCFQHHEAIPFFFGDEGAANHGRLCESHASTGIEVFVYGKNQFPLLNENKVESLKYPSRQSKEASESVMRQHGLKPSQTFFVQQNPEAIDAGVFHNDVISVMNENVFFLHEKSFLNQEKFKKELLKMWENLNPKKELIFVEVKESECSLKECVRSYLFNSQLVTLPSGKMKLICPKECEQSEDTYRVIQSLISNHSHVLEGVDFFSLKESMQNGGGPACLRLRVLLSETEILEVHEKNWLTESLNLELKKHIENYYREELTLKDLGDFEFYIDSMRSYDDLERIFSFPFCGRSF